jgi:hypothetical protein
VYFLSFKFIWLVLKTEGLPFMLVVYESRHGRNLNGVGVVGGIFKEAVVRVEELPREEEEKLPRRAAIVQPFLVVKLNVELALL